MRRHLFNMRPRFLLAASSLFLVCAYLVAACGWGTLKPAGTPALNTSFAAQADAFLRKEVSNRLFSGVVLVTQDGRTLWSRGYSMANWEQQVPNAPHTRFRIASVTKQFTGMAILILQEEGKLQVGDHVCKYLPYCPTVWQTITIHEVLAHTSGIPDLPAQTVPSSPEQALVPYDHVPLDFPPGTRYKYSNAGYILLGYVVQQVSGVSYASFIQQRILAPLHKNDTGFVPPSPSQPAKDLAIGYKAWQVPASPWVYDPPLPAKMTFLYAHGYLYSTAEDLQRWDQALFTPTLVSQRSLSAMFTPYADMCSARPSCSAPYTAESYGYGWEIAQEGSLHVFWHGGWHGGSGLRAYNGLYPDHKVTIIVLGNLDYTDPASIAQELEHMLFGTT